MQKLEKSDELIVLEFMEKRQALPNKKMEKRRKYLSKGYEGELEFIKWFNEYQPGNWVLVINYWFKDDYTMQADFILLSSYQWIVIDVKNYDGIYRYNGHGEGWLNDLKLNGDNFLTLSNRTNSIRNIAQGIDPHIQVTSAMIFINQHNEVFIEVPVQAKVVKRDQLKRYLQGLPRVAPMPDWELGDVIQVLNTHKTSYGIPFEAMAPEDFGQLRKGIYCPKCHEYDMEFRHDYVKCRNCGTTEKNGEIIYRHAIELSYLFYKHPEMVSTKNIYELIDEKISKRTIRTYLSSYFKPIYKSVSTYFVVNRP
ncbi:nuclease-related domain-containing protein [Fundicoccus culcitae]|uniref:NERD domain-containing protein n=1 Tax=Fundicoccus culcitae TaxID=2969821 RepID=A0ABY5P9N4_9LACT|nr:nuclease-related domain-containing protein [Fundicoccus culcitae]UUX35311.1 NERD domain-containing protein [Fundicoccus culcitae]